MTTVRWYWQQLRAQRLQVSEAGFTVPELIVMMVVTTMLTVLVIEFALNIWSASATLTNDSTSLVSRLNAGDAIRDDLNKAEGLITQNSIQDSHAMVPDSTAGATYWQTIHAVPSTLSIGNSGTMTAVIYYRAPSVNSSKNFIMNGTAPYEDEYVMYLNGTTKQLLLRSLANTSATGNVLKTSCPASLATTTCPADRIIADNVSSVGTRYFSRSGNLINYTSSIDPLTGNYNGPDFPSVEVVELTVNFYQKSTIHNGTNTSNETIVRVAIRNG